MAHDVLVSRTRVDSRRSKRTGVDLSWDVAEQILEHQGTVYPATAAAVPFVRELLVAAEPGTRVRLLGLLRRIADGAGFLHQHAGVPFVAAGSAAELAGERAYVAAARQAVVAGVPFYLSAVVDSDRGVRAQATYLLATLSEQAGEILPALAGRLDIEEDPLVRVCLALSVGELARRAHADPGRVLAGQVLAVLAPKSCERPQRTPSPVSRRTHRLRPNDDVPTLPPTVPRRARAMRPDSPRRPAPERSRCVNQDRRQRS